MSYLSIFLSYFYFTQLPFDTFILLSYISLPLSIYFYLHISYVISRNLSKLPFYFHFSSFPHFLISLIFFSGHQSLSLFYSRSFYLPSSRCHGSLDGNHKIVSTRVTVNISLNWVVTFGQQQRHISLAMLSSYSPVSSSF